MIFKYNLFKVEVWINLYAFFPSTTIIHYIMDSAVSVFQYSRYCKQAGWGKRGVRSNKLIKNGQLVVWIQVIIASVCHLKLAYCANASESGYYVFSAHANSYWSEGIFMPATLNVCWIHLLKRNCFTELVLTDDLEIDNIPSNALSL